MEPPRKNYSLVVYSEGRWSEVFVEFFLVHL
jgi:hypothetical protein